MFLSADAERPQAAEKDNLAVPGTRFTSVYEPLVSDMAAQIRKWMDDGFSDDTK